MTRLILLGLDGASYDFVMNNINELPTLKRLIEGGCYGVLESVTPPITIPAFPCLATSKSPEKFGIYTFYTFNSETKELKLWKESMYKDRFWDILSDYGYDPVLFNIPASYPYKKDFNGVIVSAPPEEGKKNFTHPPELWSKLNNLVGKLKLRPDRTSVDPGYIEEIIDLEDKRANALNYLLENNNWNFCMMFFRQTDRIAHRWWHTDELLKAYKRSDHHLSQILDKYDADTIIFSDHGFEGLHTSINLSYILMREGLIKLTGKKRHRSFVAWLRFNVSRFAKKHGFISHLRIIIPKQVIEKTPSGQTLSWFNVLAHKMLDFNKTEVYPISSGKVIPLFVFGDKEKVKNVIRNRLDEFNFNYNLKDMDNSDPKVPDLMLETDQEGYFFYTNFDANEPVSKVKKSTHNKRGIFIANGNSFASGKVDDLKITDLAPTILHYFNVPLPSDYEGRVLKQIFKKRSDAYNREVRYRIEKEVIKKRVEQLKGKL